MVRISSGWPVSRHISHVVVEILAPWGPAIEERPAVLTEAERLKLREEKRQKKVERRRLRREGGLGAEGREGEELEGGARGGLKASS